MKKDKVNMSAFDAYLKQCQQITQSITMQLTPMLRVQEALHKSLRPILEAQEAMQTALHRVMNPVFDELQRSFHELPARTQEALLILGKHGWYLDLSMPILGLWNLEQALLDGNVEETEDALVMYYEGRLDQIEKSISERFPTRAYLIASAFTAHRRGEYELAIPVLLAQTDGICKDTVNQYLFTKQHGRPCTASYVQQITADTFKAALLSPLAESLPISASESQRPVNFDGLNRHTVLHGESLTYGTKVNSLKAVSLVNYVAHVLKPQE